MQSVLCPPMAYSTVFVWIWTAARTSTGTMLSRFKFSMLNHKGLVIPKHAQGDASLEVYTKLLRRLALVQVYIQVLIICSSWSFQVGLFKCIHLGPSQLFNTRMCWESMPVMNDVEDLQSYGERYRPGFGAYSSTCCKGTDNCVKGISHSYIITFVIDQFICIQYYAISLHFLYLHAIWCFIWL